MAEAKSAIELEKEKISKERKENLLEFENKLKMRSTVSTDQVSRIENELKVAGEEEIKVGLELDEARKSKENLVKEYETRSEEVEKSNQYQLEQLSQFNCVLSGEGDAEGIVLFDVCPLTLDIETVGGIMIKIIPRNSVVPAKKSQG